MATEVIIGGRQTGKTVELIKRSAKSGVAIVASTKSHARYLLDQAIKMGYKIPEPLCVSDFKKPYNFRGSSIERQGVLVDDMDVILRALINREFNGIPIRGVAIDRNPYFEYFVTDLDEKLKE